MQKKLLKLTALALSATILFGSTALGAVDTKKFTDEKIDKQTKDYIVDIVYPKTGITRLDREIKEEVYDEMEDLIEDASERDEYVKDTPPYGIYITYTTETKGDTVSVLLQESVNTGGAHPNTYYEALVFDTKTNRELDLDDVFIRGSGYVKQISKLVTAELTKSLKDSFFPEGAYADDDNFEVFTLGAKGITFVFAPYQVAPYASGTQKVTIPYASLKGFIRPELA